VRRLVLILAVVVVSMATISMSGSPRPASAGAGWGADPLLNCPDLNGDGAVSGLDLFAMISSAGSVYGVSSNYLFLHDRNADKSITLTDFMDVLGRLGERCPLMETQVALATLALVNHKIGAGLLDEGQVVDLRDPANAVTAGYVQSTQYVGQMGIHYINETYQREYPNFYDAVTGEDQLRHPVGLVYTEKQVGPPGVADELIGGWFLVPVPDVCAEYGVPSPESCPVAEPVGFGLTATDEDNQDRTDITGFLLQQGWHDHTGLCFGNVGTTEAWVTETFDASQSNQDACLAGSFFTVGCGDSGCRWFDTYGWMIHLYNLTPNPHGRFQKWNCNLSGGFVDCP